MLHPFTGLSGGHAQHPHGAAAIWRGLELLFRGIGDMAADSAAMPGVPGPPAPHLPPEPSGLYPGMEGTPDDFGGQYHAPFPAPQAPLGHVSELHGAPNFTAPDAAGLAAFLRSQGVPEHLLAQAMTGAAPMAPEASGAPAPPAPAPPPPTPYPTPASDCEEAQQQRQDPTRVPTLRADPQLFLEKVYYYLSQIAAKADAQPDVEALTKTDGDFIDAQIECIDTLPGTCPRFPQVYPPTPEHETGSRVWDECYTLLQELKGRRVCDAEDEAQVLLKMGGRPIHQEAPTPPPAERAKSLGPAEEEAVEGADVR